jgi:16S rRNA processing protein RimM
MLFFTLFILHKQARKLIGTDIYIEKSQLPKLKKGEYYWEELIGLEVVNKELIVLGKASNLVSTGANSVSFQCFI